MFEDWGVDKYMHSIQDGYNLELGSQYPFVFANMIKDDVHSDQMSNKGFWENKINNWYIENNQVPVAQFHFDTFKLNEYLTSHAGARGINIIDDEITKVNHDDEGNISTIESDTATYDYDFYIDCTGMRRVLMSTLGAKLRRARMCMGLQPMHGRHHAHPAMGVHARSRPLRRRPERRSA